MKKSLLGVKCSRCGKKIIPSYEFNSSGDAWLVVEPCECRKDALDDIRKSLVNNLDNPRELRRAAVTAASGLWPMIYNWGHGSQQAAEPDAPVTCHVCLTEDDFDEEGVCRACGN